MSMQHNSWQQNAFQVGVAGAAAAVSIGWFMPLSEPVRAPKRTAHYREFTASPIPVVPFGWFRELSSPRDLSRKGVSAHLQTSFTSSLSPPANSVLFASTMGFAGPTFTKTVQYQAYASGYGAVTPAETVTLDKWHRPLAEPVRARPKTAFHTFHFFQPTPIISIGWFTSLSEPVRVRRAPPQSFHYFQPSPVVPFGWFEELSIPKTRARIGLSTHLQISFVGDLIPRTPSLFAASLPISGPTFTKTVQYQAYAFVGNYAVAEIVTVDKWFASLSEPVRLKPGLRAPQQRFFTTDAFPIPFPDFGWFQPFSNPPVMTRQGLPAKLQQALAQGAVNEVFNRSPSTGPLFMRKVGGKPQVYWRGRTRT
jgi:hypothetical protein